MAPVVVRPARPEDWSAVAGLLVELGRGVAAGTADDSTHRMQFTGHLRRIDSVTLVAEDPGGRGEGGEEPAVVLGVVDMEYHQRLGDHRPQARVNDVVVTESARGRGVGRALLSRAEELARKRGCFRMALVTAGWREESIAFYRREGWADYGAWFVKPLSDDVGPGGAPAADGIDDT
jgi:GNAT superfamily N-acetyltransferase